MPATSAGSEVLTEVLVGATKVALRTDGAELYSAKVEIEKVEMNQERLSVEFRDRTKKFGDFCFPRPVNSVPGSPSSFSAFPL
jgi:hypothetical protein